MLLFEARGSYEVPCYKGVGGRSIDTERLNNFWSKHGGLQNRRGCYVFSIRAGRGFTPIYVGKATKTFKQECFTYHKLAHYHRCLVDYAKGTPVMFFVLYPRVKGKTNHSVIRKLEEFLIRLGVDANLNLSNVKGAKTEEWGISGVLRSGKGQPSKSAQDFKQLLGL